MDIELPGETVEPLEAAARRVPGPEAALGAPDAGAWRRVPRPRQTNCSGGHRLRGRADEMAGRARLVSAVVAGCFLR